MKYANVLFQVYLFPFFYFVKIVPHPWSRHDNLF